MQDENGSLDSVTEQALAENGGWGNARGRRLGLGLGLGLGVGLGLPNLYGEGGGCLEKDGWLKPQGGVPSRQTEKEGKPSPALVPFAQSVRWSIRFPAH